MCVCVCLCICVCVCVLGEYDVLFVFVLGPYQHKWGYMRDRWNKIIKQIKQISYIKIITKDILSQIIKNKQAEDLQEKKYLL